MGLELHTLYGIVGLLIGALLLTYLTRGATAEDWFETDRPRKKKKKRRTDSPMFSDEIISEHSADNR